MVAGIKSTGFTAARATPMADLQQQMLHCCGGAPTDGERHPFSERKAAQLPSHGVKNKYLFVSPCHGNRFR